MSEETKNFIKIAYDSFVGNGMYISVFLVSVLYVLNIVNKKDIKHEKTIKACLGYYSIFAFVLVITPIFANLMIEVNGEDVYWRVYWLLPIAITIPYMLTQYIFKNPKLIGKITIGIVAIFLIILSGKYVYNKEEFIKVDNFYKFPDDVLDIIQVVSEDDEEYKKLAGPLEFIIYTRQYDGTILLAEPRSFSGVYSQSSIVTYLEAGNLQKIYDKAKAMKCNYVVMNHKSENEDFTLVNHGFKVLKQNATYTLYKLDEITAEKKST